MWGDMTTYKVTFERTQFYTLEVEAHDADDACAKAEELVKLNGVEKYYSSASKVELTDCWVEQLHPTKGK